MIDFNLSTTTRSSKSEFLQKLILAYTIMLMGDTLEF
jgi:hypothetical protein